MKIRILLFLITCFVYSLGFSQFDINGFKAIKKENFNPDFNNYDQKTALFMAHLSNLAYEDSLKIKIANDIFNLISPKAKYKYEFIQDKESSSEVLLFGNKEFVVISFRGTQEAKDFFTDGKFLGYRSVVDSLNSDKSPFFKNIPTGHGGFRKAIMNLIKKKHLMTRLDNFIERLGVKKEEIPIYTTGHSLGGALSSLFIGVLVGEGYNFKGAYHFAPPLAIWKSYALKLQKSPVIKNCVYDIVNNTDYISRVPRYGRKNFKHLGKFYRIYKNEAKEPLIYNEVEKYFKYRKLEKFNPYKTLFDRYHRLSHYIEGVSFKKNDLNSINIRSKELKGCSSMRRNCSVRNRKFIK
jgi:hypothetical protein